MTDKRMHKVIALSGLFLGALGVLMLVAPLHATWLGPAGGILLSISWAALAFVTVVERRVGDDIKQLRSELRAHDERELDRTQRVLAAIDAERTKESRHEYYMEQSLERLENRLGELSARTHTEPLAEPEKLDILFVTSNGAGLGHVSRLMAMAKHLGKGIDIEFLTLSSAYKTLSDVGYTVHYFPSADAAEVSPRLWNQKFTHYLSALVRQRCPAVVVFDGTWVYHGLTYVCRGLGIPLVWVQRGNWKPEVDKSSVQRHNAVAVADEVILPADYAIDEQIDVGTEIQPIRVGPITLLRRSELLDRSEALHKLGLDPAGKYVLVNLGGGSLGESVDSMKTACAAINMLGSPWRAVIVKSPLSNQEDSRENGALEISAYPVMRYCRAFEFAITAAGYNAVQEAVSLGVPNILVPNEATVTDDQTARARGASEKGLALMARGAQELEISIRTLADDAHRQVLKDRLATVEEASGGLTAAGALSSIVERSQWENTADMISPVEFRGQ